MPVVIIYMLKLSVSLALVYLFYQLLLRRLTFYHSNRRYLLGYTILCFFIPFINITPVVENNGLAGAGIIRIIPSIDTFSANAEAATMCPEPVWFTSLDKWDWFMLIAGAGTAFLFLRFLVRLISFRRLKNKATLLSDNGVKLYHVNDSIIPFSFGNSVFINRHLHDEHELQEIIRHEFVHVKQRHTIDIIWAELLCMLNWYNPFAWLLKAAIRQNLEFIADHKVLEHGLDKKQYQYLLLKVIGNNHFSIAQQFNFSSLKKRIAMMNKIKSARVHLLRFLFILPLLAVILVSFRQGKTKQENPSPAPVMQPVNDTIPDVTTPNDKGFIINVKDKNGECLLVIKDKKGKEVERLLLTAWNEKKSYYENLYGMIPPPPPPDAPSAPVPPIPVDLPPHVAKMERKNYTVTVKLKDGKTETYDLSIEKQKKAFEEKYGEMPEPPDPPTPPDAPVKSKVAIVSNDGTDKLASLCDEFEISNEKAIMHLKNGQTEEYDLTNIEERRKFEKKYGRIIDMRQNSLDGLSPVAIVNHGKDHTVLAPMAPLAAGTSVLALDPTGNLITGEEDVLVIITKTTTRQQLEEFKKQMKAKDIELTYDEIEYDEKGMLVSISGKMKSKDGQSNFNAFDFNKLTLAMVKYDGRTYFKVSTGKEK